MNRPYYVHTPRNMFGENLVRPDNGQYYKIRSVHTGKRSYMNRKDLTLAEEEAKVLNDAHETMLAQGAHI